MRAGVMGFLGEGAVAGVVLIQSRRRPETGHQKKLFQ